MELSDNQAKVARGRDLGIDWGSRIGRHYDQEFRDFAPRACVVNGYFFETVIQSVRSQTRWTSLERSDRSFPVGL